MALKIVKNLHFWSKIYFTSTAHTIKVNMPKFADFHTLSDLKQKICTILLSLLRKSKIMSIIWPIVKISLVVTVISLTVGPSFPTLK